MSMTKTILSILFIAATMTMMHKMKHKLNKPADNVLLQHLDHITRYDHDFSESDAGTCGQLFDIATEIFANKLARLTSFSEFSAMRNKSQGFLKEECRHSSGGYTWILLKLRKNGRACDLHVPINLFNFHYDNEFSHPLLNKQYAIMALQTGDSHCYDDVDSFEGETFRLSNINVADFKSSAEKFDEEFSRPSQLGDDVVSKTKSERKRKALLGNELLKIKINLDQTRETLGAEEVQEYDEKINNLEEQLPFVAKGSDMTSYDNFSHAVKDLYSKSLKLLNESDVNVEPITEKKETPIDEKVDSDYSKTIFYHFVTLADLLNVKKNTNNDVTIPNLNDHIEIFTDLTGEMAPKNIVSFNKVQNFTELTSTEDYAPKHKDQDVNINSFSQLSSSYNNQHIGVMSESPEDMSTATLINTPSVYYFKANGLMGGPRNCEAENKDRLINLIHAQATAANVEGYVLYRENIVECTTAVKGGIEYTAVIYLNDEICSYTISMSPVTGGVEIVNNAVLEERVKPCKNLFGFN